MRELVVLKRRHTRDRDRDITLAWSTAMLTRTQDFPKLKSLLSSKAEKPRQQSGREQVLMWQTIAAYFGGTFTPMNAKA